MRVMKIFLALAALIALLLPPPMQCIKIGVSKISSSNITSTTATSTTTAPTTTELPATTIAGNSFLDSNLTSSSLPDTTTTPKQTFPPKRKTHTVEPTPAATAANATPPATTTTPSQQDDAGIYCACDVQLDLCEINCCCDRDCSPEALQVFDCQAAPQIRLEDFHYQHGLPSCQLSDGWLCVFRSNNNMDGKKITKPIRDAAEYNKWPEQLVILETQPAPNQQATHYKYGQALQLWQPETKELSTWELPFAFETGSCGLVQPLLYLQPMQSHCLIADTLELQTHLWALLNVTNSRQLLARPRDDADQDPAGLDIQVCQQLLLHPSLQCLERNGTQLDLIVDSVELQLWHNYTHILEAKLLLREASLQEEDVRNAREDKEMWISYTLVYKSIPKEKAKPSSGPLGYALGAPVLLTQLQGGNQSEADRISYYQSNASEHWLRPCRHRDAVGFGIDLARHCQLKLVTPVLPEHGNHTEYCQQLQADIWQQLLPQNCTRLEQLGQLLVSQLGRPQVDKWLPLQISYADGQQVAPIQGVYDEQLQTLSCHNMWLSVSYEFHVAELTLLAGRMPHQSVVQQARLVLGQRHDLQFDAGEHQLELPLAVTVMFFKSHEKRLNAANTPAAVSRGLILISLFMQIHRQ